MPGASDIHDGSASQSSRASRITAGVFRFVLAIIGVAVSFSSYPIGWGYWLVGVPIPVAILEPTADGNSALPFVCFLSIGLMFLNVCICVATFLVVAAKLLAAIRRRNATRCGQYQENDQQLAR